MKFSVPVIYTTTGWIEVEADDLEKAKTKASSLNIEVCQINDPDTYTEVCEDEIKELG